MEEEIAEQKAKLEELEGQLEAVTHRMHIAIQDLVMMDENYQTIYERCCAALDKLEKRTREIEDTKEVFLRITISSLR